MCGRDDDPTQHDRPLPPDLKPEYWKSIDNGRRSISVYADGAVEVIDTGSSAPDVYHLQIGVNHAVLVGRPRKDR